MHRDAKNLGPWTSALEGADLLINLAGRSVNCRYVEAKRRLILDSRVDSTRVLGAAIAAAKHPPQAWMNSSTPTIYRHALDRPMDERTGEIGGGEPGAPDTWRFSIQVAKAWEEAFFTAPVPATVRRVSLRSAMTMTPDPGGIFDVLLGLVRKGLGGAAGSGRQYVSWIHEFDFLAALEHIWNHPELDGPVNLASPNPLPNADVMRELRRAANVKIGLPATAWMLEIGAIFMRTESELILRSRRVIPARLLESGFQFRFPDWPDAARELLLRR